MVRETITDINEVINNQFYIFYFYLFIFSGSINMETVKVFIDGGTVAFVGQVRCMLPGVTYCFDCSMDLFPPQQKFQSCTIANTPRKPEHCIIWASTIAWEAQFGNRKMDKDSPIDMHWVYEKAKQRAKEYEIEGVTYFKTMVSLLCIFPKILIIWMNQITHFHQMRRKIFGIKNKT